MEPCELVWRYPQTAGSPYELSTATGTRGWLRFDERPGALSVGELDGRRWTFQHTGGSHPRVAIGHGDASAPVAEYVPWLTGGGVVSFAGGPSYCWNRSKIWSPTWCFRRQGESRGCSICVSQRAGPLRDGATVKVCGEAALLPETPILVLLAWYLRVMAFEILTESIPGV
jgi:hypothetical protein